MCVPYISLLSPAVVDFPLGKAKNIINSPNPMDMAMIW